MAKLYSSPSADGFYMPAEYEKHHGTILIWPVRPGSWGNDPSNAQEAFCKIISELSKNETVYLLTDKDHLEEVKRKVKNNAVILEIPSNDSWARDVAPTFVTNKQTIRGINWKFNAWGGEFDGLYSHWELDDKVASLFCENTGKDYYDFGNFVLEGGSIHTDGEGTLLVTKSCLLSKGRNPELTMSEIESTLKDALNVSKVLWLPYGIYNDETNEHVDNVCCFTSACNVVLAWTDNQNDPQYKMSLADYEYLQNQTDAKGRKIIIHKLPIPDVPVCISEEDMDYTFEEGEDTRQVGERLAASYVNFYFGNNIVLVPQFGGENKASDKRAIDILTDLCKDRKVIGIDSTAILLGGGNIHCITQQIPFC